MLTHPVYEFTFYMPVIWLILPTIVYGGMIALIFCFIYDKEDTKLFFKQVFDPKSIKSEESQKNITIKLEEVMENKAKGFTYVKTPYNYISYYKDNIWTEGVLREEDTLTISATSTSLHYGQQAFEGLKAYRRKMGGTSIYLE